MSRSQSPTPKSKQTVFVVTRGEAHEGGRVEAVFKTSIAARRWVEKQLALDVRKKPWVEVNPNHWFRGIDMYDIDEFSVKK
jgi:hypothetical protein